MPLAMMCDAFGPPEALALREVESRALQPGEVRIAVAAAAVNPNDALKIAGRHHEKPQPPFAPGSAVAGVVTEVGEGVAGLSPGDRVLASMAGAVGGFATEAVARASTTARLHPALDFATAAGFSASYMSAFEAVANVGKVAAGETVVVTGAAGGLGVPAIEIARAHGARVIAVVSSDDKADIARQAGADEVIRRLKEDVRDRVLALTGGRGAAMVIELVGGDAFRQALRYVDFRGRIVITGFTSGDVPEVRSILLLLKGIELRGANLTIAANRDAGHYQAICDVLFGYLADGRIRPRPPLCFPFGEAAAAMKRLETGDVVGKVALAMDGIAGSDASSR